ncbi:hypothetical protein JB92DRAFT_3118053 [Gautieria morchelliformis]|nr:hypothetical protein JB92DRAFT_3118053 [Gautieria morchelliformis]
MAPEQRDLYNRADDDSRTHGQLHAVTAMQHHTLAVLSKTTNLSEATQLHTQPSPAPPAATAPSTCEPVTSMNDATQRAHETTTWRQCDAPDMIHGPRAQTQAQPVVNIGF